MKSVNLKSLSGPRRKYGDVSGEEFSVQARREEGAYPQRSVTDEQRSLRRKGPPGASPYLRLGPLSLGVVPGAASMFALGAATNEQKPLEYKVVSAEIFNGDLQKRLNEVGAGWQLLKADTFAERHAFVILSRPKS